MKTMLIPLGIFFLLILARPSAIQGQTGTTFTFSDQLSAGETFVWEVDSSFNPIDTPAAHLLNGAEVTLNVLQAGATYTDDDISGLADFFEISFNDIDYDFSFDEPLWFFIMPVSAETSDGTVTNPTEGDWICLLDDRVCDSGIPLTVTTDENNVIRYFGELDTSASDGVQVTAYIEKDTGLMGSVEILTAESGTTTFIRISRSDFTIPPPPDTNNDEDDEENTAAVLLQGWMLAVIAIPSYALIAKRRQN